MKTLYMRRHELSTNFIRWEHPFDETLPKVFLDKKLPQVRDASDAYAVQALNSAAAGQNTFELCGIRCEVASVYHQGLLVTAADRLAGRSS